MPRFEPILRAEITRLARKEVRAAVSPFIKRLTSLRREVARLKQTVAQQRKLIGHQRSILQKTGPQISIDEDSGKPTRLSPPLIKKLRKRLNISQIELAQLLSVSPSSVAFWEQGRNKPSASARNKIVALRQLGRREIRALLEEAGEAPRRKARTARTKPKRKPARKRRVKKTAAQKRKRA